MQWISKMRFKELAKNVHSIGFKLFCVFLVSIVISCSVSGWMVYSISADALKEKVGNNAGQSTRDAAKNVDLWYKQMEGLFSSTVLFAMNNSSLTEKRRSLLPPAEPDISAYKQVMDRYNTVLAEIGNQTAKLKPGEAKPRELFTLENERDNLSKKAQELNLPRAEADKEFLSYIQRTVLTNANMVSSVALIRYNGESQQFTVQSKKLRDNVFKQPWAEQTLKEKGKLVYLPPQKSSYAFDNNENVFAVAKAFWSPEDTVWADIIVMEFKMQYFEDMLRPITFGGIGEVHLIGQDGTTYFSNRQGSELGQPAAIKRGDEAPGTIGTYKDDKGSSYLTVASAMENQPWTLIGAIPESKLMEDAQIIKQRLYWLLAGSVVAALLLGWWGYMFIGRPMLTARIKMQQAEQGDLSVRLQFRRSDEIGSVGQSFDRMMEQLGTIVGNTGQSARELIRSTERIHELVVQNQSASKEIATAMDEVALGAVDLASDAEKSSDLTSRLHNSLEEVAERNLSMQNVSKQIEEDSRKGFIAMQDLSEQSREVEAIVKELNQKVEQLKDSTDSISVVLVWLQDISKKINILSMNASIVAASSGEAGKAFMVVAQEIRSLAAQSQKSIDSVGDVIQRIQSDMLQTNELVSKSMPIFTRQLAASDASQDIFSSVSETMQQFSEKFREVWASLQSSMEAGKELNAVLLQVSAVSQEFTASTENVSSLVAKQNGYSGQLVETGNGLEQVSGRLRESLSGFQTND